LFRTLEVYTIWAAISLKLFVPGHRNFPLFSKIRDFGLGTTLAQGRAGMSKNLNASDETWLSEYLENSYPAQWVGWWMTLPEGREKSELENLIFEEGNFRPIDESEIRAAILRFVRGNDRLRGMALIEAQEAALNKADLQQAGHQVRRERPGKT
jgi:hypothetical protein